MSPMSTRKLTTSFRPRRDTQIKIRGRHFRLTIDAQRGGEITHLQLFGGSAWNHLIGRDDQTFPQLRLRIGRTDFALAHDPRARIKRFEATPDRISFQITAVPAAATGRASPWRVTLGYEIHAEGAVFIDLKCKCAQQSTSLAAAAVCLSVDRHLTQSAKYRDLMFSRPGDVAVSSARVAFGVNPEKSFTNECQVIIEDKRGLVGDVTCKRIGRKGRFVWSLAETSRRLPGPVRYQNRLALALGAAATGTPRTNVIGQRIYHWINWLNPPTDADWFPTPDAIDKMVANHATMLILHDNWMCRIGVNGRPHAVYDRARDDKAMRDTVKHAHRRGLRVGLYVRGIERYALDSRFFERYLRRNFDGLYVDWAGPHATAHHERAWPPEPKLGDRHFSSDGTIIPARDYFLHTKRLRQVVGPRGFMICHMGGSNGGILANLAADGYLPGETGADHNAFADRDTAFFKGMKGGVTCTPWTLDAAAYRTPEAIAKMAAWGFYPHVLIGIQRKPAEPLFPLDLDDPLYAFPLTYWRILSTIDVHRATVFNLPSDNVVAARCNRKNLGCLIYKESRPAPDAPRHLVLIANTSGTALKAASIELDRDVLGMSGQYQVSRIDPKSARPISRGKTIARLNVNALPRWAINGFLLTPSAAPNAKK